jgi:tyrosyl-DNA phosphodiesterase-1
MSQIQSSSHFVLYVVCHGQTFTRVTSRADGDHLSWFLLTSANLSKPAWGEMRNGDVFDVKSYELGVLIFPGLYEVWRFQ